MKWAVLALALASPFLFPWLLCAALALASAFWFPLAPLACGILLDALYYAQGAFSFPLATALGALATVGAFFVHRSLETGIMRA